MLSNKNGSDMKGLFYIVKGHYLDKVCPCVECSDGVSRYIGGYDPSVETHYSTEWYRVLDNTVFHCIYAGSSYEKALLAIQHAIEKYKTRRNYFKYVCEVTTEDYYEVHYLGHTPLTKEQRDKKSEGRCPRRSPSSKALEVEVLKNYGNYYLDDVTRMEDLAYESLKDKTPIKKTKKVLGKTKITPLKTPQHEEISSVASGKEKQTKLKKVTPVKKLGVKRLSN